MFPGRLADTTAEQIQALIDTEAQEGSDLEFKRELAARKGQQDPWMGGGKIGDEAKSVLAREIVAFANAQGGTLVVGIGEDPETKRAVGPIVRNCMEAAAILHQSISDRVETRLPIFECEGIVTEKDGSSGVIVMRVLGSHLAPHRHTGDNECYIRRGDRAEPMSMLEVHEMVRQVGRSFEDMERGFARSAEGFFRWIPEHKTRTHPERGVQGTFVSNDKGGNSYEGHWALRISARPLRRLPLGDLPRAAWLRTVKPEYFKVSRGTWGEAWLGDRDVKNATGWQPRLRGVERELYGWNNKISDQIGSDGQVERWVFVTVKEGTRPKFFFLDIMVLMWHVASVLRLIEVTKKEANRNAQAYGIEIEFFTSDQFVLSGYSDRNPGGTTMLPNGSVTFPRYEINDRKSFDEMLTLFERDVWNLGGSHPEMGAEGGLGHVRAAEDAALSRIREAGMRDWRLFERYKQRKSKQSKKTPSSFTAKDALTISLSATALAVAIGTAYFNIVWQEDYVSVVAHDAPFVDRDDAEKVLEVPVKETGLVFINSGNRAAVIITLRLFVLQQGAQGRETCGDNAWGARSTFETDFTPLVVKAKEVVPAKFKIVDSLRYKDTPIIKGVGDKFLVPISEPLKAEDYLAISVCLQVRVATPSVAYYLVAVSISDYAFGDGGIYAGGYDPTGEWRRPKVIIKETGTIFGR